MSLVSNISQLNNTSTNIPGYIHTSIYNVHFTNTENKNKDGSKEKENKIKFSYLKWN